MNNVKERVDYIIRVVRNAAEKEYVNITDDAQLSIGILDDENYFVALRLNDYKVLSRARYRLINNFSKNYGGSLSYVDNRASSASGPIRLTIETTPPVIIDVLHTILVVPSTNFENITLSIYPYYNADKAKVNNLRDVFLETNPLARFMIPAVVDSYCLPDDIEVAYDVRANITNSLNPNDEIYAGNEAGWKAYARRYNKVFGHRPPAEEKAKMILEYSGAAINEYRY